MIYTVKRYNSTDAPLWNSFIDKSRNGTFLFHRDFMEYHSDRFEDFSLLVFEGSKLLAVLPANRKGIEVYSHQGLTYGGLVYGHALKLTSVIKIFSVVLKFLTANGIDKIHIKTIPHIYHKMPSDEMDYALFLTNAVLVRRDSLSVIDLQNSMAFSKDRNDGVKRGVNHNLNIVEEADFEAFWNKVLVPALDRKHGTTPVHTLQEIILLHEKFPDAIRQFNVYRDDVIVAGTTFFVTDTVAHSQYTAATADKNETGSLDFLYHHLITKVFADKKYFDFGISNEQQGRKLNGGLSYWKESFGARTVVQDFYVLDTSNFKLPEDFLT